MSSAAVLTPGWRIFRFLGFVVIVFLLQVGLIFWLSNPETMRPRSPSPIPKLEFVGTGTDEVLALNNPALLALPNPQSFSGEAWMSWPPPEYRAFDWNESPRWLPFQSQSMDSFLARLAPSDAVAGPMFAPLTEPGLNEPGMLKLQFLPSASTLRVLSEDGSIIQGALPQLPSWHHSELLTNSVVQVVVTPEGRSASVTLLTSSEYKAADDYALQVARNLRYAPVAETSEPAAPGALRWAQLVFDWHTLPPGDSTRPGAAP